MKYSNLNDIPDIDPELIHHYAVLEANYSNLKAAYTRLDSDKHEDNKFYKNVIFAIVVVSLVVFVILTELCCSRYKVKFSDGYKAGYFVGYEDGFYDGADENSDYYDSYNDGNALDFYNE